MSFVQKDRSWRIIHFRLEHLIFEWLTKSCRRSKSSMIFFLIMILRSSSYWRVSLSICTENFRLWMQILFAKYDSRHRNSNEIYTAWPTNNYTHSERTQKQFAMYSIYVVVNCVRWSVGTELNRILTHQRKLEPFLFHNKLFSLHQMKIFHIVMPNYYESESYYQ